ncbi:hypothetical protein BBFGKLBO_01829 [Synechococcus sp. CBW1107]|nr:hypothetical protein BBFGKLBO_01829 [Synechococcus sp. CBW1107]
MERWWRIPCSATRHNHARRQLPMTIALLIALVGSLVLMNWIVKRLSKA